MSNNSILYLSHGGGPLPLLGEPGHKNLITFIQQVTPTLIKPSAIVVISAHWEADLPTITSGAHPALIYDYSGFPKTAYDIKYPALGAPVLAQQLSQLLQKAGLSCKLDDERGFDHGLFVPLKLMYPEANIPCVQLSLVNNLQPEIHIQIGKALADLKNQDVLILGSGFLFHNLKAFFSPVTAETQAMNLAFEHWLIDTCTNDQYSEAEREQRLIQWASAPAARYCHPREEHLLPLHVCYGAAGSAAKLHYEVEILGRMSSAYVW